MSINDRITATSLTPFFPTCMRGNESTTMTAAPNRFLKYLSTLSESVERKNTESFRHRIFLLISSTLLVTMVIFKNFVPSCHVAAPLPMRACIPMTYFPLNLSRYGERYSIICCDGLNMFFKQILYQTREGKIVETLRAKPIDISFFCVELSWKTSCANGCNDTTRSERGYSLLKSASEWIPGNCRDQ